MNKHDNSCLKVLIVDDNIGKGNFIKAFLYNEYGIKAKTICNYSDAVDELSIKYNYIFVDFFLDGKCTGDNFAKVYQKKYPNCKVTIFSGRPDQIAVYGVVDFGNLENYIKEIMADLPERKETKVHKNNNIEIIEMKNNILKNIKSIDLIENSIQVISEQYSQIKNEDIINLNKEIKSITENIKKINEKLEKKSKFKKVILWITDLFMSMYKIIRGKNDDGKDKEIAE